MKKRRRWQTIGLIMAFILMFIPINALAMDATTTEYTTGDSVIALDVVLECESVNAHTETYKIWSKDNILYLAVASTHELEQATLNGVVSEASTDAYVHPAGEKITINGEPAGGESPERAIFAPGQLQFAHWTVFMFPMFGDDGLNFDGSGEYPIYVEGIGGGHDVDCTLLITIPMVDIELNKTWIGGPMTTVSIQLYRQADEADEPEAVGAPFDMTPDEGEDTATVTRDDLAYTDDYGRIYMYSVKEADTDDGYYVTHADPVLVRNDSGGIKYTFAVTNRYIGSISVDISKDWHDDDDAEGLRPDDITVYLWRAIGDGDPVIIDEATFDYNDGWEYSFDDLPEYSMLSEAYTYSISEDVDSNYMSVITGNIDDGFIVANYLTGKTDVTVNKIWVDDDDAEGLRPEQVKIQLWRYVETGPIIMDAHEEPDVDALPAEEVGEVVTFGAPWSYTYQDLDKYDEHGRLYHFFVYEVEVDDYYISDVDGWDIINTLAYEADITVTKSWVGDGDHMDMRPDEITVRLWRAVGDEDPVEIDDVTLDADGDWEYTFEDMDRFDNMGQLYIYSVSEDAVTGYTTVINGFAITNTAVIIPDEIIPEVLPTPTPTPTPIPIPDEEVPKTGQSATNSTIYGLLLLGLAGVITYFSRRKHRA